MSTKMDAPRPHKPIDPASAESKIGLFHPVGAEIFAHELGFEGIRSDCAVSWQGD